MGVDIYFKSGRADFSCRLYWISDLFDQYGQCPSQAPKFKLGKKLNPKEIKQLLDFLIFCLQELKRDKKKKIAYYDSAYFKKIEGLIKRLDNFLNNYSNNPDQEKAEIQESFNEKISLVQKIIPVLTKIASGQGSVRID